MIKYLLYICALQMLCTFAYSQQISGDDGINIDGTKGDVNINIYHSDDPTENKKNSKYPLDDNHDVEVTPTENDRDPTVYSESDLVGCYSLTHKMGWSAAQKIANAGLSLFIGPTTKVRFYRLCLRESGGWSGIVTYDNAERTDPVKGVWSVDSGLLSIVDTHTWRENIWDGDRWYKNTYTNILQDQILYYEKDSKIELLSGSLVHLDNLVLSIHGKSY